MLQPGYGTKEGRSGSDTGPQGPELLCESTEVQDGIHPFRWWLPFIRGIFRLLNQAPALPALCSWDVYSFVLALPFGMASVAWVFTEVLALVPNWLRQQGIAVI